MEIVALVALAVTVAFATIAVVWPWRIEAKLEAATNGSTISFAGGLDVARTISLSAAAVLGGPGVVAIHLGKREVWRRSISRLTVDAFFAWLNELLSRPPSKKGAFARLVEHAKDALVARTDLSGLLELGVRVLLGLRDISFEGSVTCGFEDPALTGKTAAWLFPVAGLLAPFGTLGVALDWSGRSCFDAEIDASFRIVPAKVAREGIRFARHHLHARTKTARLSAPPHRIPASLTGDT
jgi:hypothetical protein